MDAPSPKSILRQTTPAPPQARSAEVYPAPRGMPCAAGKFKAGADEVPFRSPRSPWQQDTAGRCAGQGLGLGIVSCSKKSRLRKSRCEITFKVFPPPNQKNTVQPTGASSQPHSSCREAERTQSGSSERPGRNDSSIISLHTRAGRGQRGLCISLTLSWGLSQDLLVCLPTSDTPESEETMTGPGLEKEEAKTSSRSWCPRDPLEGPEAHPKCRHTNHVMAGTSGLTGRAPGRAEGQTSGSVLSGVASTSPTWTPTGMALSPPCLSLFLEDPSSLPVGTCDIALSITETDTCLGRHYRQKQPRLKLPQTALLKRSGHSTEKVRYEREEQGRVRGLVIT